MKYSGMTWMGWVIVFVFAILYIAVSFLLLGYGAIIWLIFSAIVLIYCLLHDAKDTTQPPPTDNEYFTDEDFIHCKIGEWVSRPK